MASAKAVVEKIAADLRKRGITCWYSETGVYGGEDFARIVPPEINACKVFLFIIDEGATTSYHMENELGLAFKRKHELTILPFRVEKCPLSDWMQYYLVHIQIMNKNLTPYLDERIEELADRIEQIVKERQEAERKEREAAERLEAEHKARREAEHKAQEAEERLEAERKAREEAERKVLETAKRLEAEREAHRARQQRNVRGMPERLKRFLFVALCLLLFFSGYSFRNAATPKTDVPAERKVDNDTNTGEEAPILPDTHKGTGEETLVSSDSDKESVDEPSVPTEAQTEVSVEEEPLVLKPALETISVGYVHTVGVLMDGSVRAKGRNNDGQCNVDEWRDTVAVSAGDDYTVGLRQDKTVVITEGNSFSKLFGLYKVTEWQDIVAVSAGRYHTVGLRQDGTVVAVGSNGQEQLNVDKWRNIVAVSAGGSHTVGLCADGTVVAVGSNDYDELEVGDWTDIVAVSAGSIHTVGLRKDGTVVTTYDYDKNKVKNWQNIVAVSARGTQTMGLRQDGTVVTVGNYKYGQQDVEDWTDIVAVSAGSQHAVGLKKDGTVVTAGRNNYGQCDVSDWTDIRLP